MKADTKYKSAKKGYKYEGKKEENLLELSIREQLIEVSEEKYRAFSSSLLPGVDYILGVRIPVLRNMAKEITRGDWNTYMKTVKTDYFEEIMLYGFVIGYIKTDIESLLGYVSEFIPYIQNWSVCDSFCATLKTTKKHKKRVWEFLQPYLESDKEYSIRFGVVMILNYYIDLEYIYPAFEHFNKICHQGYYVKMAIAWAISIYFREYPKETLEYLKESKLDNFTYNKALQKITESLKTDESTKIVIRNMKRKS